MNDLTKKEFRNLKEAVEYNSPKGDYINGYKYEELEFYRENNKLYVVPQLSPSWVIKIDSTFSGTEIICREHMERGGFVTLFTAAFDETLDTLLGTKNAVRCRL